MGVSINTRQAYSEVDEFLGLISNEHRNKIPKKLREFFREEKDTNYIKGINVIEELPNKDKMLSDEVNNARTDLYNYKKSFNEWLDAFASKVDNNLNNLLINQEKESLELVENQVEILNIGYLKNKRNDWVNKLNKIKTTIK